MDRGKAVPWNLKIPFMSLAIGVQLLLISSSAYAQSSVPISDSGVDLRTDLTTTDSATQPPVSFTSISTVIVTVLSTLTPAQEPSPPSSNTTASTTSSSGATLPRTDAVNLNISTKVPPTDISTDQTQESITTQNLNTEPLTTGLLIDVFNKTFISTSVVEKDPTTSLSSSPSISNSSDGMETMQTTSLSTMDVTDNDMMSMTTVGEGLITYELDTDSINPTYQDFTTVVSDDEGIFTESFLRLVIIAGASAGSCLILLIVVFIIVACCHRRRQRKKNARYYEFKKKDFSSKYEKVEQKNSLARGDHKDGGTPIGGGWVFNSSGYHADYEDETTHNVALRSVSPLAVARPLLKVSPAEDQNGVPDSGHGGSITADDSALGLSPSLEEDIEIELSPLYRALGTSVGTGSEVRDHSYIGGDSDTISEGNEPVNDTPIRDVLFNSFGANRVASEEAVEL